MKKDVLRSLMALLMGGLILNSCQSDKMLPEPQVQDESIALVNTVIHSLKSGGCIDPTNPVYFKETAEQDITWGSKKNPFIKTVKIVYYNTLQDFVFEVMSTNGWSDLIIDGNSVWVDGPVAANTWGVYQMPLPEGWSAGDAMEFTIKVAGHGPQARYDLTYELIGLCSSGYGTVTDNAGNTYETVVIDQLEWMRVNLRTLTFNNGDPIPNYLTDEEWIANTGPACGIYNHLWVEGIDDDEGILASYGALYNFQAVVDPRGICPDGWRMPTKQDWLGLIAYVESTNNVGVGNQLKSCRQQDSPLGGECNTTEHPYWLNWDNINYGTDAYGFSAIPGGTRNQIGGYGNLGYEAHYWSSDPQLTQEDPRGYAFGMRADNPDIYMFDEVQKRAMSVRCVRDKQ